MLIQYFSDIHLEFGPLTLGHSSSDVIIAAGDIGPGRQGLDWLLQLGKPVVYVAGNHEFYGREHGAVLDMLKNGSSGSLVRFLEKEAWYYRGVRFLGCTLWSDLGGDGNERMQELVERVNDFRRIRHRSGALTPTVYRQLHQDSHRWLINELEVGFDGPTVVVTHHAPTPWSWRDDPTQVRRHAYCNDLKEVLHDFDITAWVHGHTHAVSDYRCAGARIVCNPRGYYPDHQVAEFDSSRILEI